MQRHSRPCRRSQKDCRNQFKITDRSGFSSPRRVVYMLSVLTAIDEALDALSPRERRSSGCPLGIDIASDHTLGELGTQFHLTRQRIRQIESSAMRTLMHPGRADRPRQFPHIEPRSTVDQEPGDFSRAPRPQSTSMRFNRHCKTGRGTSPPSHRRTACCKSSSAFSSSSRPVRAFPDGVLSKASAIGAIS